MNLETVLENAGIVAIVTGVAFMGDFDNNAEAGIVIGKSNHELQVDLDRDGRADRVLRFAPAYEAGYDYAQNGNFIVYQNKNKEGVVTIKPGNEVKKINGTNLAEIQKRYQVNRHLRIKTR